MIKDGARMFDSDSSGDADYDIVMTACGITDTCLFALLQHLFMLRIHEHVNLQTNTRVINISILDRRLTPNLSRSLLFIHALYWCDTTWKPYEKEMQQLWGNVVS